MVTEKNPDKDGLIHIPPEVAIAEADVRSEEAGEFVRGSSLWRDAWRRLLKNKLAVFGLIVVVFVTLASIFGPMIIKRVFGFTPDYIPTHDARLSKSFPPFTGPAGEFSWQHPMGTDNAGRDQLARVLQGGQISLLVGIISTLVSLIIGVSLRRYRGILWRAHRQPDDAYRGRPLLAALHNYRHRVALDVSQPNSTRTVDPALCRARLGVMVDDGADRPRAGFVLKKSGVCTGRAGHRRFVVADHLSPPGAKHAWSSHRLRHAHDSADHVDRGVSFLSWVWRATAACFVGQPRLGRNSEHRDLSVAVSLSGSDDGAHAFLFELSRRWLARRSGSTDEDCVRLNSNQMINNGNLLEVKNLSTYFETEDGTVKAVDDVSFQLKRGETLGIVGESGSGKSVTNLSIIRLIPDPPGRIVSGRVIFNGSDLLQLSNEGIRKIRGRRIAMIFQDPMTSLNPFMKISRQLMEMTQLHLGHTKAQARAHAIRMLETVGIPDAHTRADSYPHEFSGGMRQRVMIAMALSCEPELLIADEPTTALDVTIQAQILELIKKLKSETGTSVILITHDLGVVAGMTDHVIVMYAGKIFEQARTTSSLLHPEIRTPRACFVRCLIRLPNRESYIKSRVFRRTWPI